MITELNTIRGRQESDWTINVHTSNASTGMELRPAVVGYRYGIKNIVITVNDNEKVEILNGTAPLIGPINLEKGCPWALPVNDVVIYCTRGNALTLKTESEFAVHCFIEGITDTSPDQASNPSPSDTATGISIGTSLSWTGSAESHSIYFGTTNPPNFIITQAPTIYKPDLEHGTTYYWRIDEYDGVSVTEGDVWSFTTA